MGDQTTTETEHNGSVYSDSELLRMAPTGMKNGLKKIFPTEEYPGRWEALTTTFVGGVYEPAPPPANYKPTKEGRESLEATQMSVGLLEKRVSPNVLDDLRAMRDIKQRLTVKQRKLVIGTILIIRSLLPKKLSNSSLKDTIGMIESSQFKDVAFGSTHTSDQNEKMEAWVEKNVANIRNKEQVLSSQVKKS